MKIRLLLFLAVMSTINLTGQNLIGYKRDDIVKYMRENNKNMNLNSVVNSQFNYLKYSDNDDSETILFFLGNDLVCTGVRLICDVKACESKIKEFNSAFRKTGDNTWIDSRNGKNYRIDLSEDSWSYVFNITSIK